jgi:UDP:flavonoid glycosyltransferase YjiC (YdhE family)
MSTEADMERLVRQAHMLAAVPAVMGALGVPPGLPPTRSEPAQPGSLPPNARVEPYIPFGQLMPHVDVMITNGGYGGVQFALAHGVPLVMAGITEEKLEIATRVAWSGAGINLRTSHPTHAQIRTAVQQVLHNPSYRRNAERIRADYGRHDAPGQAVALLEQLAATRRPVLRSAPLASQTPSAANSGRGRPRASAGV